MKGIIKGSIFSIILIIVFICIFAILSMFVDIHNTIFKSILWGLITFSVFAGSLPVAKSAENMKLVKALAAAFITLVIFIAVTSALGGSAPTRESGVLLLLGLTAGFLGGVLGIK